MSPRAAIRLKQKLTSGKKREAMSDASPAPSQPGYASFDSAHITVGAGVAIFHLASSRVVLCYHTRDKYWFLPKGRKDVNEPIPTAAEREGFEESGYRNRVFPIPIPHRQPQPKPHFASSAQTTAVAGQSKEQPVWACEPIWVQLMPVTRSAQYILFWFIAETVPPEVERSYASDESMPAEGKNQSLQAYQAPPPFGADMTIIQRIALEQGGYEPVRHQGTGVDEEEACYESSLVDIGTAISRLGKDSVSADVVRKGWQAIQLKREMEAQQQMT